MQQLQEQQSLAELINLGSSNSKKAPLKKISMTMTWTKYLPPPTTWATKSKSNQPKSSTQKTWRISWISGREKELRPTISKCNNWKRTVFVNSAIKSSLNKSKKIWIWQCYRQVIASIRFILTVWEKLPLLNSPKMNLLSAQNVEILSQISR